MLGTREKLKAYQGQYETMELLRAIEPRYMQEGFLVREVTAATWCSEHLKIPTAIKKGLLCYLMAHFHYSVV